MKQAKAMAEKASAEQAVKLKIQQQAQEIERLQQQLADLRPVATLGANQLKDSWNASTSLDSIEAEASLQQQVEFQGVQIAALKARIADARRYAVIGEARLNKWRSRLFRG